MCFCFILLLHLPAFFDSVSGWFPEKSKVGTLPACTSDMFNKTRQRIFFLSLSAKSRRRATSGQTYPPQPQDEATARPSGGPAHTKIIGGAVGMTHYLHCIWRHGYCSDLYLGSRLLDLVKVARCPNLTLFFLSRNQGL